MAHHGMSTIPALASVDDACASGLRIRVRGLVQGVGFRPVVWRIARDCALSGEVRNDGEGVLIRVWGEPAARARFLRRLQEEAPPLARVDALEFAPLPAPPPVTGFHIAASAHGDVHTGVVPDAATCAECLADVLDPANRRSRYAFTNCTHCGPRLSILRRIPYDRANTSMAAFAMCPACRAEYETPADRRFHAQPNACPRCGPRLWLERAGNAPVAIGGDPIENAQRLLRAGHIVAIKGIGGIHLACDAANADAVERLRRRKHRDHKPFALMARDEAMIRRYCHLGEVEAGLLRAAAAPIVLLRNDGPERLAEAVAPRQGCYGFMLPYAPLHHLLMTGLETPIVLTSGNRSEEPQCIANEEARTRLAELADALLLHDRDIVNRLDDSVVRVIAGVPAPIRRARGYAPTPLRLPSGFADAPPVLALGGQLKSTFCLLAEGAAIVSQHLGDLENAAANAAYRQTLDLYRELFQHRPQVLAIDAHPDYLPSKLGRERAAAEDRPLVSVQHHHAHIAACLADNAVAPDAPPVLGVALDGTGYGDDATLWGGEFLLADYRGYERLAAFAPVAMPGGLQAIRQPWRMGYCHLRRACEWAALQRAGADLPFFRTLAAQPLQTLEGMLRSGFNSPLTTSCGRLFDAVAAVTGLCPVASYEGQAAMELEAAAARAPVSAADGYPFTITHEGGLPRLEPGAMWQALMQDLLAGIPVGSIAARFHAGLADGIAGMVEHLAAVHGDRWAGRIALSGGVFQNALLSELLIRRLEDSGLQVLRHRRVPANDGGLSLGQAAVAAMRAMAAGHG